MNYVEATIFRVAQSQEFLAAVKAAMGVDEHVLADAVGDGPWKTVLGEELTTCEGVGQVPDLWDRIRRLRRSVDHYYKTTIELRTQVAKTQAECDRLEAAGVKVIEELRIARGCIVMAEDERDLAQAQVGHRMITIAQLQLEIASLKRQVSSYYWTGQDKGSGDSRTPPSDPLHTQRPERSDM